MNIFLGQWSPECDMSKIFELCFIFIIAFIYIIHSLKIYVYFWMHNLLETAILGIYRYLWSYLCMNVYVGYFLKIWLVYYIQYSDFFSFNNICWQFVCWETEIFSFYQLLTIPYYGYTLIYSTSLLMMVEMCPIFAFVSSAAMTFIHVFLYTHRYSYFIWLGCIKTNK